MALPPRLKSLATPPHLPPLLARNSQGQRLASRRYCGCRSGIPGNCSIILGRIPGADGGVPCWPFRAPVAGRLRFPKYLEPITFQARQMASWPCVGIEGVQKYAFKAIGLSRLPVCHPARQCRGPATVPRHTAIENMVLAVGDNGRNILSAITLQRQADLPAIPPR